MGVDLEKLDLKSGSSRKLGWRDIGRATCASRHRAQNSLALYFLRCQTHQVLANP